MKPVQSSAISAIGYNPNSHKLTIDFKSGQTWEYDGVAPDHYDALMSADSVGKHFHEHIRGTFHGRQQK